ncbi:phosphodiester glycosidase family protein [Tissierella sp.]|uniref:phosphodiester glycosidase family protein n=1 Tax=Tissierella sp. TaxID=41274 RepID=UPI00285DE5A1|nr:phosphodiester glycosidase family protein [Tissierella sp.]MDR7856931.1 phosphodiester glycosidase family protein [Tissierella sp.]
MRKNIKKVFVCFIAAATIFTSSTGVLANKITVNMPYSIYETVEKNNISSGVVHEKIMKFTTAGWWNINVLRIDLLDPYTDIKGLINPESIIKRDKVSSLVEKHNAVAGINGDFFSYTPLPWALSPLISEGELVSMSRESNPLPSFFIDVLNQGKIGYFNTTIDAVNLNTEKSIRVNVVNNVIFTEFQTVTLLNKNWGPESIGTKYHNDAVEVVVDNDVVAEVRQGKEAVAIPENGYVLIVRGPRAQELLGLSVGDKMELKVKSAPDINEIKFSMGGGSFILENGELRNPDTSSPGDHPRSGIGISKEGTEIILVTIDGRDSSFKGVSQEMFGAIMRDLGAHNALNLDGGGSTAMAIKAIDESKATVVNKPSEGTERLVINAVGVFSNAPEGKLTNIKISTDDTNMFVDTTRKLNIKGYDEYYNPVTLDETKLEFTIEGVEGNIEGNVFKAESTGQAKITVKYEDIVTSIDLNVLGTIKDINTSLSSFTIGINSERTLPIFSGKDAMGFEAKIYPEDITFSTINEIGYVVNNVFYSEKAPRAGILTAKIGEGLRNIHVYVGNDAKLVSGFENIENIKFTSYPNTVTGEVNLNSDAKEGKSSVSLKYDFSKGEKTRAAYVNLITGKNLGMAIPGNPKSLGLWVSGDNSGSWLRGIIKDNKGNSHYIDFAKNVDWTGWKYVTANLPTNISYPITIEKVYAVETDSLKKQSGELLFDGLIAQYTPVLGNITIPTPSALKDNKNVKSEVKAEGFSIGITSEPTGLDELVKYDATSKIKSRINNNNVGVLLNGVSEEFKKDLKNSSIINASGNYNKNNHKDMFFLHVNTQKGGIRATNPEQWNSLRKDLENIKENNIVLLLSSPVFGANGFTDTLEANLFHKYLIEARDRGKNVFVVHGGNSNTSDLRDNIRYIGINTKTPAKAEDIYDLSIVEFVVNGSDVTYQINPLFQKPNVTVGKK